MYSLINNLRERRLLLPISLLIIIFFYSWDLSNLDGLRQGTEGFYLQISKEMYNSSSYLTPLYRGSNHWSKPPLHFWAPMPFYKAFGGASLFAARFTIALLSVWGLFLISNFFYRQKNIKRYYSLFFFASTLGFFKYSRIYMMEIPLTLFTVLSSFYFYEYIQTKSLKKLSIGAIFLGASILIKGPVSLVMAAGANGIYTLYLFVFHKKNKFKEYILWALMGTVIGSIWFILCFKQYGSEFFDYFFIRENLGKFKAKPYPMSHVFQGLIIFGLPWSLYLPFAYFRFKDLKKDLFRHQNYDLLLFLTINFFVFFSLWLIPSQRSHHYAVPSLPLFLSILLLTTFDPNLKIKRENILKFTHRVFALIVMLFFVLFSATLFLKEIQSNTQLLLTVIFSLFVFLYTIVVFFSKNKGFNKLFAAFMFFGNLWVFLIPSFSLPYMPTNAIKLIGQKQVAAVVRKPYFVEEALNKEIDVIDSARIKQYILENNKIYMVHKVTYRNHDLKTVSNVALKWKIWKRGRTVKHIIEAFKKQDLSLLKDEVLLLVNKPLR